MKRSYLVSCILYLVSCVLLSGHAFANSVMNLSLKEAISLALENNLDIRIERYNPHIQKTETEKERAIFDPVFMVDSSNSVLRVPTSSEPQGAREMEQEVFDFNLGFKKRFSTGAYSELKFTNERVWSNSRFLTVNPSYKSQATLTLTQPFFKNFGPDVNLSRIRIAENNEEISRDQLRGRIVEVITNTQKAYWNLVLSIDELEVRRLSFRLAKDLLEKNRKRVDVGVLAPIEIIEAEVGVASREEAVLVTEKAVKDAEDALRKITGLTQDWEGHIVPTDKPSVTQERLSFYEAIERAFKNRYDYLMTMKELKNKEIYLRFTKNQTFPNLAFIGTIGLNGLDRDYSSNLEGLKSGDFYSWRLGLTLEIPLRNRAAKTEYLKARLEEEKTKVSLRNLEEAITLEIREALREIDTTLKRIDATRVARVLAEKRLEAEDKRFNVGMSTSHDILIFQEELANALRNEKKALIDHNNALINLEKVTGTAIEEERY